VQLPADAHAATVAFAIAAVLVYRRTGTNHPHLTIHQVNGGPFGWNNAHGRDAHVAGIGPDSPYDFRGRAYAPFIPQHQAPPAVPQDVRAIINSFATAMGY
jgi:hypothetical protein